MIESFEETFNCSECESADVLVVASTDFTQIDDFSCLGEWAPEFDIVKKVCPDCREETQFSMNAATWRGRSFLVIDHHTPTESEGGICANH